MSLRRRLIRPAVGPSRGHPSRWAPRWVWVLLCLQAVCIGTCPAAPAAGPDRPDDGLPALTDIRDETRRLTQAGTDLAAAVARRTADAERLEAQLARDEATLRARDVRTDMLRAARVEFVSARERTNTLEGMATHQRAALARTEQTAMALAQTPPPTPDDDLATLRREAALRLLGDQAAALRTLIGALDRLTDVNERLVGLAGQRLRLLQGRARLDSLDDLNGTGPSLSARDPQVRTLEQQVTDALQASGRLADEAAATIGEDPQTVAHRQDLELRLQDTAARADVAQNALELLGIRRRLEGLGALGEDPSMPVELLEDAAARLGDLELELGGYLLELRDQRQTLAERRALARDAGRIDESGPAADLGLEITRQEQEVQDLLRQAREAEDRIAATAAAVYTQSLTDQRPVPVAREDWQRIARGARGLPRLLVHELGFVGRDLRTRAAALEPAGWTALIGGALALAAFAVWARRLLQSLAEPHRTRNLAVPADALAAALPLALPALLWTWTGTRLALPGPEFLPVLLVLAVGPLSVFALRLARSALFGLGPATARPAASARFYRSLRWGLLLAALVAALYLVARSLPISPLLGDVLDRLAMLGLLLLAGPAFALHRLLRDWGRLAPAAAPESAPEPPEPTPGPATDGETPPPLGPAPRGHRLLAELSRLTGVVLVATGLLGLLGYANIAWTISSRLAWLALVATALYFLIGILGELRNLAWRRIDGEGAEFWRRQFVAPAHRFAVLATWLTAGWALVRLWGWTSESPVIRVLLDWGGRPLVQAGNLSLTPWHLALAALLAVAAVWSGGWVRRVSFRLAFGRVRDRGLRQALATLTQYLVIVCGVLLALKVAGLDLTTLTVFVASLGVGIGFGLQNIVNNFISGILLLVERPLRVGDVVTVGTHEGEVAHIGIRSLTVRTFDKQEVIIPNGTVISGEFINWTRSDDLMRTVLTVGIGYQDDPDRAIALVREVLNDYEPVLANPRPQVSLWEFGDSAVVLRIEYCIHLLGPVSRTAVRSEVNRRIWYGFQRAGISIPFPQRDLHVRMLPGPDGGIGPSAAPGPTAPGTDQ